jgi:protein-tyrosine sulfotransferase
MENRMPQLLPPIFILGFAKSGTTLLQSLLDNHPELFVLPVEIQFFKYPNIYSLPPGNMPSPPLPTWKTPIPRNDVTLSEIRDDILSHADFEQVLKTKHIERNIALPDFNVDKFLSIIKNKHPESLKELFLSFFEAFFLAWKENEDVYRYRFVEKTPHQEEYAQELKEWFPNAKFIHVLRNPYANLYSMTKVSHTKKSNRHIYSDIAKSFYFLERNKRYIDNYHVVKYEDIVFSTESTMRHIADFLEIEFLESLLQPTICGIPWGGNPRSIDEQFKGIDPRPATAFESKISAVDVALINRYFSYFIEKYGYDEIATPKLKQWLPVKWETPIAYLKNRAFLFDTAI